MMMKIALDYDGTWTLSPKFWGEFVVKAHLNGVDIRIVTHRHDVLDQITDTPPYIKIIYTDGVAKKWFCEHRGDRWVPDVWIDDKPKGILENGPLTEQEINEWRATR
jgi:hypothetical protein